MRLFVALDMPWSVREQLAALSGSGHSGRALGAAGELPPHTAFHRRHSRPCRARCR